MKRWSLLLLVTVLAGLFMKLEPSGTDVASLEPVELVYIQRKDGVYLVLTDTGQQGRGTTAAAAIADLKATSPKTIFLGTAEHLLVTPEARGSVMRFARYLRPDCTVCIAQGEPDMEQVTTFLDTHRPKCTVNDLRAGDTEPPALRTEEGGTHLEEP